MKILLVKPPSTAHVVLLPIGLGYIAAYLRHNIKGIEVIILDCLKESYDHIKFSKYIERIKPDLVGITAFTMEIESALRCCGIIKKNDAKTITAIGGPHPSSVPEQVLNHHNVDFIFRSEAEIGFSEFISELLNGKNFDKVHNIGYKENGEIKLNKIRFPENLDEMPMLDYELLKFDQYPKTYMSKKHPYAPIITSRGCPFACTYCSAGRLSGKKLRARSPEKIIEEIKYLQERYKIKEFQIWDDNFTLNKTRAHEFCDILLKENIGLPWWCPNGLRLETLDEELIRKMKKSGLYAIALGIESGSEKIQKDMRKNLDFERLKEVIELGNKYRIRMQGFFILGYPTETREDILKTIRLMKELPLQRASIMLFQPLVGSGIYDVTAEDIKKKFPGDAIYED